MYTNLRQRARSQEGFTLIELLVVILIIGILAAIALPSFTGQTAKANDASAKSNVRNAVAAMESCFTDRQTYVGCDNSTLQASGLQTTTGTDAGRTKVASTGAAAYTVTAYSTTKNTFSVVYNAAAGTQTTYECTTTGGGTTDGGCNTQWTGNGN